VVGRLMLSVALVAAAAAPGAAEDAGARVAAVQRAAGAASPALAARLAEVAARGAEARAGAAAFNPTLEWQSEGLAGERTPNAQDTVRLATPFLFFGQAGPARELTRVAEDGAAPAREAARRAVAVEATRRWLALAAAGEIVAVRRERVERLETALSLLEARHQLGEVAGTEVAQLDLEHSTASSELELATAAAAGLAHGVAELCGEAFPSPQFGDLEKLTRLSVTPAADRLALEVLAAGPPLRLAGWQAELETASARFAAAAAWGLPEVEAEWERFPALEGLDSYDAWGFRIAVPLPLGSAGSRQRVAARERQAAAAASFEAVLAEALREARGELAVAAGAEARLRSLEPLLADVDRIEASLFAQYRLGAIGYLEYVAGVARHDEVLLAAIDARAELLAARLRLGYLLDDPALFPAADLAVEEGS